MRSLRFEAPIAQLPENGRRVRQARFEARSSLPASAACVVANGVRETLTSLLGSVTLRLFEPVIPDPNAWQAITRDAILYRVRGSVADGAVILRSCDAIELVSAVFSEPASRFAVERMLSPIELDVIDRIARAIAANLAAVCGARDASPPERVAEIRGFVTFFELLLEKPAQARVGIALSRDPSPEPSGCVEFGHLAGVRVAAAVTLDLGTARAAAVTRLAAGAILPIRAGDLRRCALISHGRRLARGICGIRNGRYAFAVHAASETA
jgi:hypothetical protein